MKTALFIVIMGTSMEPTLQEGCTYRAVEVDTVCRGDVVLFNFGHRERQGLPGYVKRVIAVPGDTLRGSLVPGEPPAILRYGSYYVLSDNLKAGKDSRHYGPIRRVHIRAKIDTVAIEANCRKRRSIDLGTAPPVPLALRERID